MRQSSLDWLRKCLKREPTKQEITMFQKTLEKLTKNTDLKL